MATRKLWITRDDNVRGYVSLWKSEPTIRQQGCYETDQMAGWLGCVGFHVPHDIIGQGEKRVIHLDDGSDPQPPLDLEKLDALYEKTKEGVVSLGHLNFRNFIEEYGRQRGFIKPKRKGIMLPIACSPEGALADDFVSIDEIHFINEIERRLTGKLTPRQMTIISCLLGMAADRCVEMETPAK